jgi:hypothetical protein
MLVDIEFTHLLEMEISLLIQRRLAVQLNTSSSLEAAVVVDGVEAVALVV